MVKNAKKNYVILKYDIKDILKNILVIPYH